MSKTLDWSVLDEPGIKDVAKAAARAASNQYDRVLEFDDALQEAYIVLASDDTTREYIDGDEVGLGALTRRVYQKLVHQVETEAKHKAHHVSLERLREGRSE